MSDRSGDFTRSMVADAIEAVSLLDDDAGSDARIAVNLPVRTFEDGGFAGWFGAACRAADVAPDRFVFEISEGDMGDATSITDAIDRLTELGVSISVDDFGAGHSTFERLRWRNVAQLKLDRPPAQCGERPEPVPSSRRSWRCRTSSDTNSLPKASRPQHSTSCSASSGVRWSRASSSPMPSPGPIRSARSRRTLRTSDARTRHDSHVSS